MRVLVGRSSGEAATAILHEPKDFKRLHVEVVSVDPDAASAAVASAGLGYLDGGDAWLDVDGLRAAVRSSVRGHGDDPTSGFDGMVDYARSHDWLSADGRYLKAHCELR